MGICLIALWSRVLYLLYYNPNNTVEIQAHRKWIPEDDMQGRKTLRERFDRDYNFFSQKVNERSAWTKTHLMPPSLLRGWENKEPGKLKKRTSAGFNIHLIEEEVLSLSLSFLSTLVGGWKKIGSLTSGDKWRKGITVFLYSFHISLQRAPAQLLIHTFITLRRNQTFLTLFKTEKVIKNPNA